MGGLKQKYNKLLKRIEKGERWLNDEKVDWQERWEQYDLFKNLLFEAEKVLSEIMKSEQVTSEQINNGFEVKEG